MSYYFDIGPSNTLDPDALCNYLKKHSGGVLNLDQFLATFSTVKPLFTRMRQSDQIDVLLQLVDYLGKALVKGQDTAAKKVAQAEADRGKMAKVIRDK